MKYFIALAVLITATIAAGPNHPNLVGYSFDQFVADFKKGYVNGSAEYIIRRATFDTAIARAQTHNAQPSLYKMGINKFSDWSVQELSRLRGNKVHLKKTIASMPERVHRMTVSCLPRYVDWRTTLPAVLTAVKDQGHCGSCWAHAATEEVESHWAMATGELFVLSQQQVTSCTPTPNDCGGTGGCGGAIAESAFDYVVKANGQIEEWEWGYTSYFGDSGVCKVPSRARSKVSISGYTKVTHNNATAVMDAVAHAGPLAISVDASGWSPYDSGVFDGCSYAKNISMDHAVQLIGYGYDIIRAVDYWLVRNSWSASWGERGYIRLLRRAKTECGWNVNPSNGDGCKGQTAPEWACGMCGIAYDALYPNPHV